MLVFPWKQERQHNDAVTDTCLQEVATLRVSTVSRICSTLWLKLQRKSPKHLLQPGIIYKHLSILKAEQLALIEGRRIMGRRWQGAASLAQRHRHSYGAPRRLVGNKVPWTGVKPETRMTLAVVNSRKCKTRTKSLYKTTGRRLHVDQPPPTHFFP